MHTEPQPNQSSLPSSRRAWRGAMMHSLSPQELVFWPDGGLIVDAQGVVESFDNWQTLERNGLTGGCQVTKLPSTALLIPGLIDLHVHLPQVAIAGRPAEDLLDWLNTHVFAEEARFSDPAYARDVSRWFFKQLLANGTTTAAVFLTSDPNATNIAFEEARDIGNRVVMGQNLMDLNAPTNLVRNYQNALPETEALYQKWHGADDGRLSYAWIPRFALSCSEEMMDGIGKLRQKFPDAYLHTHLSEQLGEIACVRERFPKDKDYTAVYERFGLLGPKTILAHGIHLSDDELARIKAHQSALAHCPGSNFFLKSGRFRWFDMIRQGVLFGLGSDVGGGPALSILQAMRDAQYQQAENWVAASELFFAATLGGAQALFQEDKIGNFQTGKEADFVILDLNGKADTQRTLTTALDTAEDWLSRCIYLGDDRLVHETYIRGQCVYTNRP